MSCRTIHTGKTTQARLRSKTTKGKEAKKTFIEIDMLPSRLGPYFYTGRPDDAHAFFQQFVHAQARYTVVCLCVCVSVCLSV